MSLIKAVNDNSLNEFFNFLKKKPTMDSRRAAANAADPAIASKNDDDDDASPNISDSVSILHQFADAVKGAPSGRDRYVLRMTSQDLKQHYLKSGVGGKAFVEQLDDKTISSFANLQTRVQNMLGDYDVHKLISKQSKYDCLVLLDVPKDITNTLKKTWSGPTDINGIRDALNKMMNHKYYKMAISASRLKKIESKVAAAWDDMDELTRVLDPSIIVAYPSSSQKATIQQKFVDQAENDERSGRNSRGSEEEEIKQDGEGDAVTKARDAEAVKGMPPAEPKNVEISNKSSKEELGHAARKSFGTLSSMPGEPLRAAGLDATTIEKVRLALDKIR